MIGLASCSNGSRMLTPKLRSRPAPRWQASMMPPPAPVMTMKPASAMARANASAVRKIGVVLLRARRAEGRDLADVAVGREHLEGGAHLLQRARDDLQIADAGAALLQARTVATISSISRCARRARRSLARRESCGDDMRAAVYRRIDAVAQRPGRAVRMRLRRRFTSAAAARSRPTRVAGGEQVMRWQT